MASFVKHGVADTLVVLIGSFVAARDHQGVLYTITVVASRESFDQIGSANALHIGRIL